MNKCIALNTSSEPCPCLTYDESTPYCGHHKNEEFYNKMLEKRANKHKVFYQENKQALSDKHKIYYQENKDRLLKKYDCECGVKVSKICLKRHYISNKHKDYLEIMKNAG